MSFAVAFAYQRAIGPSIPSPLYPFLRRVDVLVSMGTPSLEWTGETASRPR